MKQSGLTSTRCSKKVKTVKLFAVLNFSMKFDKPMCHSYLHLTTKQQLIIFKYNEVIDI